MANSDAAIVRDFVSGILRFLNFDNNTIYKINKVIPLEYFPAILAAIGLLVLLICILIVIKRNNKKREEMAEEEEFRKSEEIKKEQEDERLVLYSNTIAKMCEELEISEARLELELEKLFNKSAQLKEAEVYHRVTVARTAKERDILISNWYTNNDKVNVIQGLIKDELNKSEAQNIKNEKYIQKVMSEQDNNTWECGQCGNINKASETKCLKCGHDK